jgi:hypothetical protein
MSWFRQNSSITPLSHNRIRSIYEDADGDIWELLDGRVQQSIMKRMRFAIEEIQERQANENAMDVAEEKYLQRMEQ